MRLAGNFAFLQKGERGCGRQANSLGKSYLRAEPSTRISLRSGIIKPLRFSRSRIIAPFTLMSNGEFECRLERGGSGHVPSITGHASSYLGEMFTSTMYGLNCSSRMTSKPKSSWTLNLRRTLALVRTLMKASALHEGEGEVGCVDLVSTHQMIVFTIRSLIFSMMSGTLASRFFRYVHSAFKLLGDPTGEM